MDLATIIILGATVIGGILYSSDKYIQHSAFATRGHLLFKFEAVKAKNLELQQELEGLIASYDAWGKTAFPEADTNFVEYLDVLKEKLEIVFSGEEYDRRKKTSLTRETLSGYLERLRYQQEVLIALRHDLSFGKDTPHAATS